MHISHKLGNLETPLTVPFSITTVVKKEDFLTAGGKKTTFQWPDSVSGAIFLTNLGYIWFMKVASDFFSGTGSNHSGIEEKATHSLKWPFAHSQCKIVVWNNYLQNKLSRMTICK